jgi:4-amino-4-deoxy-L-arabinose transferase-like glycosyltransferase
MTRTSNTLLWLLVSVLAARLGLSALLPFADTTEPRYAEMARIMAETGDWITPWFDYGVPFWGKPPLSFWTQALSFKLFGVSEFAGRLPSWLAKGPLILVLTGLPVFLWALAFNRWQPLWHSLPWGIAALAGLLRNHWRRNAKLQHWHGGEQHASTLVLLAALAPALFFTLAGNILWTYVLPGLPFVAALASGLLTPDTGRRITRTAVAATLFIPALGTLAGGWASFQLH